MFFLLVPLCGASTATVASAALVELGLYSATWFFLGPQPSHAPGPSDRERFALSVAEAHLSAAQESKNAAEIDRRTQEVESRRAVVNRKECSAAEFPIPKFLQASQRAENVNIAVTGASGVGKSSFINALRRMKRTDPGAAATKSQGECTMEPTMYDVPSQPNVRLQQGREWLQRWWQRLRRTGQASAVAVAVAGVGSTAEASSSTSPSPSTSTSGEDEAERTPELLAPGRRVAVAAANGAVKMMELQEFLEEGAFRAKDLDTGETCRLSGGDIKDLIAQCKLWDLPGVGTQNFPQDSYVKEMGLRYFDMVVFVASKRPTEAEAIIMKELKEYEVPYLVVRTCTDLVVEEAKQDAEALELGMGPAEVEESAVLELRSLLKKDMEENLVYLVSTWPKFWEKWDFPQMRDDINSAIVRVRTPNFDEDDCFICSQKYKDIGGNAGFRAVADGCQHAMCTDCWAGWMRKSEECPFCRQPVGGVTKSKRT